MGKEISEEERLKRKQIFVRATLEIAGNPKEYVEKAIQLLCDEVERQGYSIVSEEIFEAEKKKDTPFYVAFAELTLWVTNMDKLVGFAFDFLPSSIEIVKPIEYAGRSTEVSGMLNDLVVRLHDADMKLKTAHAQVKERDTAMVTLIRNMTHYLVREKARSAQEISELIGVQPKEIETCLKPALEQGKIIKKGQTYTAVALKKK